MYCRACNIDEAYITNFGEEVVRGQPVFVLSILLRYLKPMLRASAGVGSWQARSANGLTGVLSGTLLGCGAYTCQREQVGSVCAAASLAR